MLKRLSVESSYKRKDQKGLFPKINLREERVMQKRLFVALVLIAALVGVLVGCGGPGGNGTTTQYTLTVDVEGNGSVDPDGGKFDKGAVVDLTVTAEEGEEFIDWAGTDADDVAVVDKDAGEYKITMDSDKEITAVFTGDGEVEEDPALFNFEETTHGFDHGYGGGDDANADISYDDTRAYLGEYSLKVEYNNFTADANIARGLPGDDNVEIPTNTVLTYHFYVPADTDLVHVQPFVTADGDFTSSGYKNVNSN